MCVLRKNIINGAEELRTSLHRDGRETGIWLLFLEALLKFELRNCNGGCCALGTIILCHLPKMTARRVRQC